MGYAARAQAAHGKGNKAEHNANGWGCVHKGIEVWCKGFGKGKYKDRAGLEEVYKEKGGPSMDPVLKFVSYGI